MAQRGMDASAHPSTLKRYVIMQRTLMLLTVCVILWSCRSLYLCQCVCLSVSVSHEYVEAAGKKFPSGVLHSAVLRLSDPISSVSVYFVFCHRLISVSLSVYVS